MKKIIRSNPLGSHLIKRNPQEMKYFSNYARIKPNENHKMHKNCQELPKN